MPQTIYQQARAIRLPGISAVARGTNDDLDLEISVKSADEGVRFTASLWNLSTESWETIRKKDVCRIDLGWQETGLRPVCLGRIETTQVKSHNGGVDTEYRLEGVDASQEYMARRLTKTWTETDPGTIATEIAELCGGVVPTGVQRAGTPIPGAWPIKNDHPARYWLDDLCLEAAKLTDEAWSWDVRGGKFFFYPTGTRIGTYTRLWVDSSGGNLIRAEKATGKSTQDGPDEVEFEAYCEPVIEKDCTVSLESQRYSGEYRVSDYEFVSSTVTGDHLVKGTLVPTGASYAPQLPGHPTMRQKLLAKESQLNPDRFV